ncbi:MAG: hypothetical protein HY443_00625 [Candidatus Nealsonbacteria bacterium]|nr:hypothetical protein [Candidatus Nealsonbacteria bacterium]
MAVKEGVTIESVLVENGFMTQEALKGALIKSQREGKSLCRILVEEGLILPETLACAVSFSFDVMIVDLEALAVPKDVLELLPPDLAQAVNALAYELDGDTLRVVMEDPTNKKSLSFLVQKTGKKIRPAIAKQGAIRLSQKVKESYRRSK